MLAPNGADIHDTAGLLVEHPGQHRTDGVPGAVQIHGKVPLPHLVGHILEEGHPRHTGVVHQQGNRAKGLLRAADHLVYLCTAGHIRLDGDGLPPLTDNLLGQLLGQIHALAAVDAHSVTLPGQTQSHGPTDPSGRTRDQCDFLHLISSFLRACFPGPGFYFTLSSFKGG